jgi:hypothetical protein
MPQEHLGLVGHLHLELFGPDGRLKQTQDIHNTVTTAGKYGAADQVAASPTLPKPGWMEVGTGSPTATLLGAYVLNSRTALTSNTRATNIVTFVCTFGAGVGNGILTEVGLFDVVTQNTINMWLSAVIAITKGALDTLTVTWTLTYS